MKKKGVDINKPGCMWKRNPLKLSKEFRDAMEDSLLVCSFCGFAWNLKVEKSASKKLRLHAST
jgi:hypothetical protein